MFRLFGRDRKLEKELEIQAIVMDEISNNNQQLRKEEEAVLDSVMANKAYFEDNYAAAYLTKLQRLSDEELKYFALNGVRSSILYIRQVAALISKEDVYLPQRVLAVMFHDLADSVHNIPSALDTEDFDRSSLEFELLLILQFVHSYDDYENIQKEYLYISFMSFKNSFPKNFLIEAKN